MSSARKAAIWAAFQPFQFFERAGVPPSQRESRAVFAGHDGPVFCEVRAGQQFQRGAFAHRVAVPV